MVNLECGLRPIGACACAPAGMRKERTWRMGQSPERTEDRRQRSEAIKIGLGQRIDEFGFRNSESGMGHCITLGRV